MGETPFPVGRVGGDRVRGQPPCPYLGLLQKDAAAAPVCRHLGYKPALFSVFYFGEVAITDGRIEIQKLNCFFAF